MQFSNLQPENKNMYESNIAMSPQNSTYDQHGNMPLSPAGNAYLQQWPMTPPNNINGQRQGFQASAAYDVPNADSSRQSKLIPLSPVRSSLMNNIPNINETHKQATEDQRASSLYNQTDVT